MLMLIKKFQLSRICKICCHFIESKII